VQNTSKYWIQSCKPTRCRHRGQYWRWAN